MVTAKDNLFNVWVEPYQALLINSLLLEWLMEFSKKVRSLHLNVHNIMDAYTIQLLTCTKNFFQFLDPV